jgi:hypothetical protein
MPDRGVKELRVSTLGIEGFKDQAGPDAPAWLLSHFAKPGASLG